MRAFALAAALLLATRVPVGAQLDQADRLYAEKSFALALKAYEAAAVPEARKDEVAYRICVCLGRSEQWDRALAQTVAFVRGHRGTVWEPRGLYWLGRLYLALPDYGWRAGETVTFSRDVPQGRHGDRAMMLSFEKEHPRNAKDALEAAAVFYPTYREQYHTEAEEIQLSYDLASQLTRTPGRFGGSDGWRDLPKSWPPANSPEWRIDLAQAYSPAWPAPKKILYLYRRSAAIAPNPHSAALARLAEAHFVAHYQLSMKSSAIKQTKIGTVHLPYPYQELKPLEMFRAIIADYPADPIVPRVKHEIARMLDYDGKSAEAEKEYAEIAAGDRNDPWVKEAIATLAYRRRPSVGFDWSTVHSQVPFHLPSERIKVKIDSSNVAKFHLELRPIDLDRAISQVPPSDSPFDSALSFQRLLGSFKRAEQLTGKPVYSSDVTARGERMYRGTTQEITLPRLPAGVYMAVVSIPGVRSAITLHVSDLKMLTVGDSLFLTRAASGAPAVSTQVRMIWTYFERDGAKPKPRKIVELRTTDANGLLPVKAPAMKKYTEFSLLAFAHRAEGAAFENSRAYSGQPERPESDIDGYGLTDRPVYRPGQSVNYRFVVLAGKGGDLRPAAGRKWQVEIPDTTGGKSHKLTRTSSAFGTIAGSFTIDPAAKPGEYSISCSRTGGKEWEHAAYTQFRVEEYRKPEFEVKVEPEAGQIRIGKQAAVTISARYYFGGAVAGGEVTYRVFAAPWQRYYRFPLPYAYLRQSETERERERMSYGRGELMAQGTARTGADGRVRIAFDTRVEDEPDRSDGKPLDMIYTVEADVRDISRRTISGSGSVKATHAGVAVFLNNPRGYVSAGETVDVEIATVDPQDRPVASGGAVTVTRLPDMDDAKPVPVLAQPLATDARGRGRFRWSPRAAGRYRMAYATHDAAGQPVREKLDLWVSGAALERSRALFKEVKLFVKQPYYTAGQLARVLLVTPRADCQVLLLRVYGRGQVEKRLVAVPGHSLELSLPLTKRDTPGVTLQVVMVRNGEAFTDSVDLFVPPTSQLLDVTVRADHPRYQPGEAATFRLLARGADGRPARAELSVAVSDDALRYIQRDYLDDIRASFWSQRTSGIQLDTSSHAGFDQEMTEDTLPRGPGWTRSPPLEDMGLLREWPFAKSDDSGDYAITLGGGGRSGGMGMGGMPPPDAGSVSSGGAMAALSPEGQNGYARAISRVDPERIAMVDTDGNSPVGPAGPRPTPGTLRTRFLDTALWLPSVVTGSDGAAVVRVKWPDNLTRWRAQSVAVTQTGAVGNGETAVETSRSLLVRLQTPRFLVERDRVVLSAIVHNAHPKTVRAIVSLAATGAAGRIASPAAQTVDVPAKGEKRVDWTLDARQAGGIRLVAAVRAGAEADATEAMLPVVRHGIERVVTASGVISPSIGGQGGQGQFSATLDVPAERAPGSATLLVRVNGSTLTSMLDALPYLLTYPHNCVEQTVSRFVPAAVALAELRRSGADPRDPRLRQRGLSADRLAVAVRRGLDSLKEWQQEDGGWGWWPDGASDPDMTVYVARSLMVLRASGQEVDAEMLKAALGYLQKRLANESDLDRKAAILRVLALDPTRATAVRPAAEALFGKRNALGPRALAELAMVLATVGAREQASIALQNLQNSAKIDEAGGTVHWESAGWRFAASDVEATSAALEAYLAIEPGGEMARRARKWLLANRRGDAWSSTLQTASAIYALAAYARVNRETAPDCTVTIALGSFHRTLRFSPKDALFADAAVRVPDSTLGAGARTLTVTRAGSGTLYCSARLAYFSNEEPIPAAGGEIAVERRYYRLIPGTASTAGTVVAKREAERPNPFLTGRYELLETGGLTLAPEDASTSTLYRREELREGEPIAAGDLIEVELRTRATNDYRYVAFEDHKPAGCEPLEVRSGGREGAGVWASMELRDRTATFFVDELPQGTRVLLYRLWVETPGSFHVLPTNGYAMYAPELRTLSAERRITVTEAR